MRENKYTTNNDHTLVAVSDADGETPVYLYADPVTHGLILGSTINVGTVTNDGSLAGPGLVWEKYDAIDYTATSATVDRYRYYLGGLGATLIATITITWVAADHLVLVSAVRT